MVDRERDRLMKERERQADDRERDRLRVDTVRETVWPRERKADDRERQAGRERDRVASEDQ